jgi:hypothetical protein
MNELHCMEYAITDMPDLLKRSELVCSTLLLEFRQFLVYRDTYAFHSIPPPSAQPNLT